ncbi:MAG: HAMP domain-containing histidine kinase [Chloroflexi bacterium]|nr:HAMP domain-containing histidine kinase [Chloroflexota bacterium]
MFRSLRWRLILPFSLLILLTVLLSGALSAWFTLNRFDVFVTDEGRMAAEELAPFLEAYYAYHGGWEGLADLLNTPADSLDALDGLYPAWDSSVDWIEVAAGVLGIDPETLWDRLDQNSIAEIATDLGVDPDKVVEAIVEAERKAIEEVVAAGGLSSEQAELEMKWVSEIVHSYVYEDGYGVAEGDSSGLEYPELSKTEVEWLLSALWGGAHFLITDERGGVIFDSTGKRVGERLSGSATRMGVSLADPRNGDFIGFVLIPAGSGYYSTQQMAFLKGVMKSLVISGLVAGLLALVAGLFVARRVTAPVTALTQAAQKLASGACPGRLPVHTQDELGQMSEAFNRMANAIEQQRDLRIRLVHDIMHELYTPLSVIQLEVEAIRDGLQTPEQASEQLQKEIDALRKLIEDLSLLAEMEAGETRLQREPTDPVQLLSDAMQRWQPRAQAAGISLNFVPPSFTLPRVNVDPSRLAQVLGNLISNAIHYTPAGGRVELRCETAATPNPTRDGASPAGDASAYVCITVADTGDGIAPEDLPFVFERFYRTDRARARRSGGRGLGLAIVREIVERHGGEVWVESTLGKGSTFGFSLPALSGAMSCG